jgi:hypothetical protein
MFRNRQGYFNETWCEDTFGQYAHILLIVPLGHGTYQTEIWSARILDLATRGALAENTKSAVSLELMAGWSLYF